MSARSQDKASADNIALLQRWLSPRPKGDSTIMTFSTSAKPLSSYADGETPLDELVTVFGSHLERLDSLSKFALLASIAITAAVDDEELTTLDTTWVCIETEFLPNSFVNTDLIAMLPRLNELTADNLLGLCEALVAQLRYTRKVR